VPDPVLMGIAVNLVSSALFELIRDPLFADEVRDVPEGGWSPVVEAAMQRAAPLLDGIGADVVSVPALGPLQEAPVNPMADVEKPRHRRTTAIEVFSPEEVLALVRDADSEQDAAIHLTAAFTGLRRGELVALLQIPGRLTSDARDWTLHLPARWPWHGDYITALNTIRVLPAAA
jgi:hypothetical protein